MVRTIISLDEPDKKWLDNKAAKLGLSRAEIVRRLVIRMRHEEESSYGKLLNETSGIWSEGDGLAYQDRMRDEWTR